MGFVAIILMAGNMAFGLFNYTRTERSYCVSCHKVHNPARMWDVSERHTSGLSCPQCHGRVPGGNGRCGAFSAHPETVNPNCIGCHTSIVEGRPIQKVVEVRRVTASQDPEKGKPLYQWPLEDLMFKWHLEKNICLCTDCHRNVAHEKGIERWGNRPKMAYCRECHYHAKKDDYVNISPLPGLWVREVDENNRIQGLKD